MLTALIVPDFLQDVDGESKSIVQEIKTAKATTQSHWSAVSPAGSSSDYQQSHPPGSHTSGSSHPPGSLSDPSRHEKLSATGPPMPRPLPRQPSRPPSQISAGAPSAAYPPTSGNEGPAPYPPQPRPLPPQPTQSRPDYPNPLAVVPLPFIIFTSPTFLSGHITCQIQRIS
ncbi:hypothetical protein Pst134EA_031485 [Puccinia striiformis f. sp. tritici]|uniref:uncharacterized protein n=1 Tax=Puccinia striiformis f. sp. tritici TaxID=168172 RepID=UPI002008D6B8|nr:uncharacterized protein Pst134EA_031485 [Puccinia striiformis f. sp. tritici]KAH9445309.1 hypothetical protein Pst134EA_031485 [Puccinia striiformis f. sp. tritici]